VLPAVNELLAPDPEAIRSPLDFWKPNLHRTCLSCRFRDISQFISC